MNAVAVVVLCFSVRLVDSQCQLESKTYICEQIPQSFPEGLSSLLFTMKNVGEINSSVFHSDSLMSVTRLIFRGAGITNISDGALSSFSNLTNLVLDNNLLSKFTATWLSQPAHLSLLNLPGNHIAVLEGSMLNALTGLTSLDLARNKIKTISPGSFAFQPHLSSLNLSRNLLTYVDPQVFLPLNSTRIHLAGNPWNCSCEAEDLITFVRDLQMRSLLEREMEVKCESPAHRKGQLVWNVSRCVAPTADPVTSTLIPLMTDKPTQIPLSVTIPALIAIIVVLCVLLCVVSALAGVYGRRRMRKRVRPQSEVKRGEGGPEPLKPLAQSCKKCPEEMMNWDLECIRKATGTEIRPKSAHAVLSTSLFCGGGRRPHEMETETEVPSHKSTLTEVKSSREQGEELDEVSRNSTAQNTDEELKAQRRMTDFIDEETQYNDRDVSPTGNSYMTNTKATRDTETIPYLSIGTDLTTPKTGKPNGLEGESRGPRIPIGRAIGRVSTWPPSSIQWKVRCANQGEGLSSIIVPGPFQDSVVKSDVLSEGGAIIIMERVPNNMLSLEGWRGEAVVEELSGEPVEEPVEARVKEPSDEPTEEPLEMDFESVTLNYDPVSENLVISIPHATELLTGSAKLQLEPANSDEFPSGSADLTDRPYSTEPLTGSAELQSEPPNSTDLPSGSAELLSEPYLTERLKESSELQSEPPNSTEPPNCSLELLSEPLYSTEPLNGSLELLSEPLYSTEPLNGSAELQSDPPYSTELITPVAQLQSEPPESTEPPVEYQESQLCLVSFETTSTEFNISPDGCSQSTIATAEPQSEPVTVSWSLSGKTQNQSQTHVGKAEELLNTYDDTTGLTEGGGKQKTMFETPTMEKPEIQVLGGSSQFPPSGGSQNDENLQVNNEYVFFGLLQEVVENRGRWTRERWRKTHKNQQLYRRKAQGH